MGRTPVLGWFEEDSRHDRYLAIPATESTGVDGLADRIVGELSGKEQPRVLLEEPTAHLNLRYQDMVLRLVRSLAGEVGHAVITWPSRQADRVRRITRAHGIDYTPCTAAVRVRPPRPKPRPPAWRR